MIEVSWCCVLLITVQNLFGRHDGLSDKQNYDLSFMSFSNIRLNINDGWNDIGMEVPSDSRECVQAVTRCPVLIGMGKI